MRESACHCEGWRRLQKSETKKGFILDVAAGTVLKNPQTYLRVCFMGKQSRLQKKEFLKIIFYTRLRQNLRRVREISADSQKGGTSDSSQIHHCKCRQRSLFKDQCDFFKVGEAKHTEHQVPSISTPLAKPGSLNFLPTNPPTFL